MSYADTSHAASVWASYHAWQRSSRGRDADAAVTLSRSGQPSAAPRGARPSSRPVRGVRAAAPPSALDAACEA